MKRCHFPVLSFLFLFLMFGGLTFVDHGKYVSYLCIYSGGQLNCADLYSQTFHYFGSDSFTIIVSVRSFDFAFGLYELLGEGNCRLILD